MPTYAFECQKCGDRFDLMLKIAERDAPSVLKRCPKCKNKKLRRVISKGSGGILRRGRSKSHDTPPCQSGACSPCVTGCGGGRCNY